jgi:hypothetical protein
MSRLFFFVINLLFLALGFSCQKVDPLSDLAFNEHDIYVSNHDKNFDFSSVKTYYTSNTVAPLRLTGDTTAYTNADTAFISLIHTNLAQRGFVRVEKNQQPDVIVIVSRLLFNAVGNDFAYINKGTYEGLANPDTVLFPKPFSVPAEFTNPAVLSGSLSIDMIYTKAPADSLPVVWSGVVVGTLTGLLPGTEQRTTDGINSLFRQSPYLVAGQ